MPVPRCAAIQMMPLVEPLIIGAAVVVALAFMVFAASLETPPPSVLKVRLSVDITRWEIEMDRLAYEFQKMAVITEEATPAMKALAESCPNWGRYRYVRLFPDGPVYKRLERENGQPGGDTTLE